MSGKGKAMFKFLRDRVSWAKFPADLRQQLDDDQDVIVVAEKVTVVVHLSGHIPGVFASNSTARFQGAYALTPHRVLATFPTGADPSLCALDSAWDLARGAARVTISGTGLKMDIALGKVDPGFNGSMTLNYKHGLTGEQLGKLPATQLWSPVDPVLVYRAAGVRPRR